MKASPKIPSGKTTAPATTIPKATHGILAGIFSKLAAHHQAMANKPDKSAAPLMRPDAAALAGSKGKAQIRQPFLGAASDPNAGPEY